MKKKGKARKRKVCIWLLLAVMIIIIGIFVAIPSVIMSSIVNTRMEVKTIPAEEYGIEAESIKLTTVDGLSLAAWEVYTEDPKAIVILLSGIENPSVTAFGGYAKLLKDHGNASLLIEMRAHGESEGERVSLGMVEYLDVKAGVDYIKSKLCYEDVPIVVWGTSMGATTAINAAGEIPEIAGVISCSAYSSWPDAFYDHMVNMGIPKVIAAIQKPFVKLYLGFTYGFKKLRVNPVAEIQKLDQRPILLAHSKDDSQVPYASFERLMKKAQGDKVRTFVREGDRHFICDQEYFENPIEDQEFSAAVLGFLEENF